MYVLIRLLQKQINKNRFLQSAFWSGPKNWFLFILFSRVVSTKLLRSVTYYLEPTGDIFTLILDYYTNKNLYYLFNLFLSKRGFTGGTLRITTLLFHLYSTSTLISTCIIYLFIFCLKEVLQGELYA